MRNSMMHHMFYRYGSRDKDRVKQNNELPRVEALRKEVLRL